MFSNIDVTANLLRKEKKKQGQRQRQRNDQEKIKWEIEIFKLTNKEEKTRQDKARQGKTRLEKRRKNIWIKEEKMSLKWAQRIKIEIK